MKNKRKNFGLHLLFVISSVFLFPQCKSIYSDAWIDKAESENYVARHECSFFQAGDKFIMFGGRESAKQLDIYDYKSNTWSTGGEAPKEFNHFQATFYKGFIWVIGSFKTNNFPREIPEENIWLYHPPTKKWIMGPSIPEDRRRGGAGLVVYEDKFYLIGGNTIGHDGGYVDWFDSYDPKTNTWTRLSSASQARDHFHAAIIGKTLYAAGGRHSGGEGGVFSPLVSTVDTYNFETKEWTTLENDLPTPRAAPGIMVFNRELLVMGGEGEQKGPAYKIVESYNPSTKSWSQKADMNHARHGSQAILSGNGIYIAAGSPNRGGGNQRNMEVYNEDSPKGEPIVSSEIIAPPKVLVQAGSKQKVVLENKGGNSASFISSVELLNDSSASFKVVSELNMTLLDLSEKVSIEIEHTGNNKSEKAELKITYNGAKAKYITLISD